MGVPDFQSFFKPLLDIAADGKEHSLKEARERIAAVMDLSQEDLEDLIPSGTQSRFANRVTWAKSYFVQAKVLDATKRGHFVITERGRDLLKQGHDRIDVSVLSQYPEFVEFHGANRRGRSSSTGSKEVSTIQETPEEVFQQAYESMRGELASELLSKVKDNSPAFFERLVVDLMVAMGYGGSRADAGKSVGRSGDEGIDGIIKEDRLGLDVIYLQAKRWEGTVGRPEIQKFVGALSGKRAKKGVFITTGTFSGEALAYAEKIESRLVLIDGRKLVEHMIDFNIGTSTAHTYDLKRIDTDYFNEE